jgi:hypothetical protein
MLRVWGRGAGSHVAGCITFSNTSTSNQPKSTGGEISSSVRTGSTNTLKQHRAAVVRNKTTTKKGNSHTEQYQQSTPRPQTPEEGCTIRPDQAPARPTVTATTTLKTTTSFGTNQQ